MAKKETNKAVKTVACTGCGKGKFVIPATTKYVFCNSCFTVLGNDQRYKLNMPMYKPVHLIVGETYKAIDNYEYRLVKKAYKLKHTVFYVCKRLHDKTKETYILGDYFFSQLEQGTTDENKKTKAKLC